VPGPEQQPPGECRRSEPTEMSASEDCPRSEPCQVQGKPDGVQWHEDVVTHDLQGRPARLRWCHVHETACAAREDLAFREPAQASVLHPVMGDVLLYLHRFGRCGTLCVSGYILPRPLQ